MKKALLAGMLGLLVVSTNALAQDDESYSPPSSEGSNDSSYVIDSTGSYEDSSPASSSSSDDEGGSSSSLGNTGEADTSTFESTITALDGAGSDSGDSGGGE
jgi:hypothetical protein